MWDLSVHSVDCGHRPHTSVTEQSKHMPSEGRTASEAQAVEEGWGCKELSQSGNSSPFLDGLWFPCPALNF